MDVFTFVPRDTQTKFTRRQRKRGQRYLSLAPSARQEPPRNLPYTLIPKPKPGSATPEPSSRAVSESEARDSFLWRRVPAKSRSSLAPAAESLPPSSDAALSRTRETSTGTANLPRSAPCSKVAYAWTHPPKHVDDREVGGHDLNLALRVKIILHCGRQCHACDPSSAAGSKPGTRPRSRQDDALGANRLLFTQDRLKSTNASRNPAVLLD